MNTKKLREIAEAAISGPWDFEWRPGRANDQLVITAPHDDYPWNVAQVIPDCGAPEWDKTTDNARHIATFDPPTVLKLLDERDELLAAMEDMSRLLRCYVPEDSNQEPYLVGLMQEAADFAKDNVISTLLVRGADEITTLRARVAELEGALQGAIVFGRVAQVLNEATDKWQAVLNKGEG